MLGGVFLTGVATLLAEVTDATPYLAAAGAVIGVVLLAAAVGLLLLRHGPATANWVRRRLSRFPDLRGRSPDRLIRALSVRLVDLVRHPSRTGRPGDAAATGHYLAIGPLLTVYGLGNIWRSCR